MFNQIASFLGACCVLIGYSLLQAKKIKETDLAYLHLNFAGGFLLLIAALSTGQFGFVLLEGAWCGVTIAGYVRRSRRPQA